jgi:hemerythrin-like domain-containing protein
VTIEASAVAIERRFVDDEHHRMHAGLAGLQQAIIDAHRLSRSDAIDRVARTLGWLRREVLPHAAWEEAWLYPHVDAAAGTAWATRALRFEHDQIRDVAAALENQFQLAEEHWTNEHAFGIVVALTRLETLLAAHLNQEERLLLPLLEASD